MSCLGRTIDKWGPAAWNTLHTFAHSLPDDLTAQDDHAFRAFLDRFGVYLPCKKCAHHFKEHMQMALAPRPPFRHRQEVVDFLNEFHNAVNVRTGKRPYSKRDHMQVYKIRPRTSLKQRGFVLLLLVLLLARSIRRTKRVWM